MMVIEEPLCATPVNRERTPGNTRRTYNYGAGKRWQVAGISAA